MEKFETFDEQCQALEQVFLNARRFVHVYTRRIEAKVWSDERVINAIKSFIRGYKHAKLEVIQFDTNFAVSNEFLTLAKRLSQIQVLEVNEEILRIEPEKDFLFADTKISINQPNFQKPIGHLHLDDKARNQMAQDKFKTIKVIAKECVHFKTVMI